jgi:putative NADH-flavin reductase
MRVVVFGASGPSGKLVVRKALEAGHEVTAYVRDASKLPDTTAQVVVGELSDVASISRALAGKDAVISLLGPSDKSNPTAVSNGTRHIVGAMRQHGVRRLIATATPSARDEKDRFKVSFAFTVRMVRTFAGWAYREIVEVAKIVRASELEWTLLRLPMLTDTPGATAVAGYVGDPKVKLFSLSREALAQFAVEQLRERTWVNQAPVLSNAR